MNNDDKIKEIMITSLETVLEHSPDLMFIKDTDLNYIHASQVFAGLVGYKNGKELLGKSDYDIFDEELARRYVADDKHVLKSGIPIINLIEPLPDHDGKKSYSSTSKFILRNADGQIIGLYGSGRDVTAQIELKEEIKAKERLKIKAETDALTGLLNRASIIEQINDCINGYGIYSTHALLFIDLDSFKDVNDNLGHPFGDKVLRAFAKELKYLFGEKHIIGRIGGDEYLVLLRDVDSKKTVEILAKEVFNAAPYYQVKNNKELYVTCSIGISMYNGIGKNLEQLYLEADKAMYMAKESGKNQMAFFE